MAKVFTEKAATGFIRHTPKQFRKYHMKMFPLRGKSDHEIKQEQILTQAEKHAKKAGYIANGNQKCNSENTFDADIWLKKLNNCNGIKAEAQKRFDFLSEKLSLIDQAQDVILHMIEKNEHPNAVDAYKERMKISEIRKKRRALKNEMVIVQMILIGDPSSKMYDQLLNVKDGLLNPKNLDTRYSINVADELIREFERKK